MDRAAIVACPITVVGVSCHAAPLLAAALLRDRGKARHHLSCLHEGLKAIPRQCRVTSPPAPALAIQLEAITAQP
jgi:hypothetical protein